MDNTKQPVAKVADFFKEAQQRVCYTAAQDNLLVIWGTFLKNVLPAAGHSVEAMTVGDAKKYLKDALKVYSGKGEAKASTIKVYEARISRLLGDFILMNGADDAKWFEWKQQLEKKSAQASAAASSKFKKSAVQPNGHEVTPPAVDKGSGTSRIVRLASGGILTVSVSLDVLRLTTTDRNFVFDLIDKLDEYEKKNTPVVTTTAEPEEVTTN